MKSITSVYKSHLQFTNFAPFYFQIYLLASPVRKMHCQIFMSVELGAKIAEL